MVNYSATVHLKSLHTKEAKTFAGGISCPGFRQTQTVTDGVCFVLFNYYYFVAIVFNM